MSAAYSHLKTPDVVKGADIWAVVYIEESGPIAEIGSRHTSAVLRFNPPELVGSSIRSKPAGLAKIVFDDGRTFTTLHPGMFAIGRITAYITGVDATIRAGGKPPVGTICCSWEMAQ